MRFGGEYNEPRQWGKRMTVLYQRGAIFPWYRAENMLRT
jgi:hypothetical protein